jgi:hypothetical protein
MATPHDHHDEHHHKHHDDSHVDHTGAGRHSFEPPLSDHDKAVSERLARFMFDLQADDYDAQHALRELAWADDDIRGFWLGQADAVVSFLGLDAA